MSATAGSSAVMSRISRRLSAVVLTSSSFSSSTVEKWDACRIRRTTTMASPTTCPWRDVRMSVSRPRRQFLATFSPLNSVAAYLQEKS
jgi:hypothetical protein